jgi:hypothetical protein
MMELRLGWTSATHKGSSHSVEECSPSKKTRFDTQEVILQSMDIGEDLLTGSLPAGEEATREADMSSAKVTVELSVTPNELWQLIGGFGSLPSWVPGISQSELEEGGRLRRLHDPQGHTFVERLERYDSAARTYSYSIVKSPVAVSNYFSTITVTPINGGAGSHGEWSSVFTPDGIGEKQAEAIFHGLYSAGLDALASRYASRGNFQNSQ